MPVPALKSLAKKAGKSLRTLERYWEEAKKAWEALKDKHGKNKWAYIMAIVKRRAGLSTESLLLAGFSPWLIVEAEIYSSQVGVEEEKVDVDASSLEGLRRLYLRDKFGVV